jgi:hypothetical protein
VEVKVFLNFYFIGQHAINFVSRIYFAGAGAFSQWERLVPAPADLSVVNMPLIFSPELILQEQEHSANGSGCCRPLPTSQWSTCYWTTSPQPC